MRVWDWIRKRPWQIAGIAVAALLAILATPVLLAEARLDRKWVDNLAHMPNVQISPGAFALDHVADWTYTAEGPATREAITFANTFDNLRNVWFVVEPQPGGEYAAHTLILFEFGGDRIVGLTVEARLEQGETYDAVAGAFNKFELAYVWATARELLTRRVTFLDKDVYVYPLQLDESQKRNFLRLLLEGTRDVATHPRFYNTITSNCTNELAKVAGPRLALFLGAHRLFAPAPLRTQDDPRRDVRVRKADRAAQDRNRQLERTAIARLRQGAAR